MVKFGLHVSCLILVSIALVVYGEPSNDVKAETSAHQRNDDISADNLEKILKRLEDNEILTKRLLGRVEQLESRDRIQRAEIRNLKIALSRRDENEASARRIRRRAPVDRQYESPRLLPFSIIPVQRKVEASDKVQRSKYDHTQNTVHHQRIRQMATNPSRVAFFATLSAHQQHIGVDQAVLFDSLVTNIGNAYHNHLGSFIAPIQGTYVFSVTLMSHHKTDGHFVIAKNGSHMTTMYLSGPEGGYSTSSQTAILELQQGDDVNIRSIDTDKPVFGYNYSVFSGFLLFEESQNEIIG